MSYEEMSNFEINKLVATLIGLKVSEFQYLDYCDRDENVALLDRVNYQDTSADYCNNPSDAWPIIKKNLISVFCERQGQWVTEHTHGFSVIEVRSENPLRAAMICFLKMKDAESE